MLPPPEIYLTVEQELELKKIRRNAHQLTHAEATQLLLEATKLMMQKDNIIKQLIKRER